MEKSQTDSIRPLRTIATPHGDLQLGRRCLLMAILNVTPDSFSDGGRFLDPEKAVQRAMEHQKAGADLLDIGGESTRPGSTGVSPDEQIDRIVPVIRRCRAEGLSIPISIDTQSAGVAQAALEAGADIVNDVSGARHDADMPGLLARQAVPFVVMHMQGTPETMQKAPHYQDVVREVGEFFAERESALSAAGVDTTRNMIVDPGIGFGKLQDHNLSLLRHSAAAYGRRWPVLIGASRKAFIAQVSSPRDPIGGAFVPSSDKRLIGTAAAVCHAALSGVDMVRVHDTAEMRIILDYCAAIAGA